MVGCRITFVGFNSCTAYMEMYSSEWISDRTGTETLAERQKLFTFFCETYMAPCSKIATQKNLQEQVRAHTGDLRRMILKAIQVHVHHKFINLIPSRAQSSQNQAGLADPRSPLWKSIKSQWLCLKEYQWVPYPLINHHYPYVKLSLS